jgi:hypothetical protein
MICNVLIKHYRLYVALVVLGVISVGVMFAVDTSRVWAQDPGGRLETALEARGISEGDVVVTGPDSDPLVSISAASSREPSPVWARVAVEKELAYLKAEGSLSVDWATIEVVEADGNVLFGTRQPVEASPRPDPEVADSDALDSIVEYVKAQTEPKGIDARDVAILSANSDTVLEVTLDLESGPGRDPQIEWSVNALLGQLRDKVENLEGIEVELVRILMVDASTGGILVDYIVDTVRDSVRAWMAEGVEPVWSHTVPYVPPESAKSVAE